MHGQWRDRCLPVPDEAGNFVAQKSGGTDLAFGTINAGGTICINFNSTKSFAAPYSFVEKYSGKFTGGAGSMVGLSGTFSVNANGQELNADSQGHSFGWVTGTSTGSTNK